MADIPIAEQIAAARRVVDLKFGGFMGDQTEAFQAATRAALATLERAEKLERVAEASREILAPFPEQCSVGEQAVRRLGAMRSALDALDASEGK